MIKVGVVGQAGYEKRIRELVEGLPRLAAIVEPLLTIRRVMRQEFTRLHKMLLDVVRHDPLCRQLMTAPGVGAVVALTYRATVDQPQRFVHSRAVGEHDRIVAACGPDTTIWSITAENPHNDIVRSVEDQVEFRRLLRQAFNRIKSVHGESETIHLFPALPVSAAVDVGRVWMPKADLPLSVYDQNRQRGGFFEALRISSG